MEKPKMGPLEAALVNEPGAFDRWLEGRATPDDRERLKRAAEAAEHLVGLPVMDRPGGTRQVGVVEAARIADGKIYATMRLTEPLDIKGLRAESFVGSAPPGRLVSAQLEEMGVRSVDWEITITDEPSGE